MEEYVASMPRIYLYTLHYRNGSHSPAMTEDMINECLAQPNVERKVIKITFESFTEW